MTRMFFTATRRATAIATAVVGLSLAGGCSSGTNEAPPMGDQTMDLSNVPPPDSMSAPMSAPMPPAPVVEAPTPPAAPAQRTHTVAKGDTIFSLAAKYYGTGTKANQDKILAANPGLVPTRMTIGKTVAIP